MDYHDTVLEGGMIVEITDKEIIDDDNGELKARDRRSNLVDRRRAVRQVLCYICCAEFGSASLGIHQKTCLKKHKWGLDIVEFEEGVPRKKAAANRKKCTEPGNGPTLPLPNVKSSAALIEDYNEEALKIFYEHSEKCLWCRTKNFEAIENAQHATENARQSKLAKSLNSDAAAAAAAKKREEEELEARKRKLQEEEEELLRRKQQAELDAAALKLEEEKRLLKLQEDENRRKALEIEEARKRALEEEEERKRALEEEEEMKRVLAEEEAYRLAVLAEEEHRRQEEELRRRHEEQLQKALKFAEEEALKRKQAEEEWLKMSEELLRIKRKEEEEAHQKKLKEEADAARRRALELAHEEAMRQQAKAAAEKLAKEEKERRDAALLAAAKAEAEKEKLIQEENLRRIKSDKELMQKKKKILGKHKFLRKHEGAIASSQAGAVYIDKVNDEIAIKDMSTYSISHAKKEGKIKPHHQVFVNPEFLDVGEGVTYVAVEDDDIEGNTAPLQRTLNTKAVAAAAAAEEEEVVSPVGSPSATKVLGDDSAANSPTNTTVRLITGDKELAFELVD